MTRYRRVDGQELQCLNNATGIAYTMHHYLQRLEEINQLDKEGEALKGCKEQLENLEQRLKSLKEALV